MSCHKNMRYVVADEKSCQVVVWLSDIHRWAHQQNDSMLTCINAEMGGSLRVNCLGTRTKPLRPTLPSHLSVGRCNEY